MPTNDAVRELIDRLVACDEPPGEKNMTELRKHLERKVTRMKRRGRISQYVCLAAAILMVSGYAIVALAASSRQEVAWLAATGFCLLITGAIFVVIGCLGLFRFRGFGYVWARHDFQDAAIMELSVQVQRLSERLDELSQKT